MNVDILKFENDNSINYVTIIRSNQYIPLIILLTRVRSTMCIDIIFAKFIRNHEWKQFCLLLWHYWSLALFPLEYN